MDTQEQWSGNTDETNNEREQKGFVLYTCIHKGDPARCKFWDRHKKDPDYYSNPHVPCRYCGCRGTLRPVSTSSHLG